MHRDEIRYANFALISGRQISIRAGTMAIFLVAITKKEEPYRPFRFILKNR